MTLGLSENRRRRRHRNWGGLIKWLIVLAIVVGAGLYAYEVGSTLARQEVRQLEQDIGRVAGDLAALQVENAQLQETVQRRDAQIEELGARYDRDIPPESARELLALFDERVAAGVSAARLKAVLTTARDDAVCDNEPVTRRFAPSTPLAAEASNTVRFAEGAITVTGQGESSKDDAGNVQAWFDPALAVSLRFARLGGESEEISGMLPLYHSVVVGAGEYRFSAVAGERSFVEITADRCDYP